MSGLAAGIGPFSGKVAEVSDIVKIAVNAVFKIRRTLSSVFIAGREKNARERIPLQLRNGNCNR